MTHLLLSHQHQAQARGTHQCTVEAGGDQGRLIGVPAHVAQDLAVGVVGAVVGQLLQQLRAHSVCKEAKANSTGLSVKTLASASVKALHQDIQ